MKRKFSRRILSSAIMLSMAVNSAAQTQTASEQHRQQQALIRQQISQSNLRPVSNAPISIELDLAQQASATALKEASNGATVIDIAAPTAGGVSHNRFTRFDVDQKGVILNNSLNPVLTQLGGWADGNRRLAGGEANIILNEVTGLSRSQLQGFVEVAGKSAEFILANPNGITCNGCGFINTPRVTLVTGRPDVMGGSVNGFDVSGGDFLLEGKGLDASTVDRFDLITRAARLNADIYARQLNIVTGRNRVDYNTGDVTALEGGDSGVAFQFALDASELGAMYANSIHLVGTEKGLGVNSEGLVQSVTDLDIDVDGNVRLKNALANDSIRINAHEGDVELNEKVYSSTVNISTEGKIANNGLLAASEKISLQAAEVVQLGELYAGLNSDNSLNIDAVLQMDIEKTLENKGVLYAGSVFELEALALNNTGGNLSFGASSTFNLNGDLVNRDGTISFGGESGSIVANTIDNREGNLSLAGTGELELTAQTALDNTRGVISAQNKVSLAAENLDNIEGAIVARDIIINTKSLDNQSGTIDASQLHISATTLANQDGKLISRADSERSMTLDVSKHLDNSDGFIYTAGQILSINTQQLTNKQGMVSTADDTWLDINIAGNLDNSGGSLQAEAISINADNLDNAEGTVTASLLDIDAQTVVNNLGYLQAEKVTLAAEQYRSAGGVLLAFGSSEKALDLNVSRLIENTRQGIIQAHSGSLTLKTDAINNSGGIINLKGRGVLSLNGRIDNSEGYINASTLSVSGQQFDNTRGELTADRLALSNGLLDNYGGLIYARAIDLNTHDFNNETGKLIADELLSLQLSTLNNQQGVVHTGGIDFNLQAESINNREGTLSHGGDGQFILSASRIENLQGKITGDGSLQISADELINNSGVVSARNSLTLSGNHLDNSSGKILAGGHVNFDIDTLNNHEGYVQGGGLTLSLDSLNNKAGALIVSGGGELSLVLAGAMDNQGGIISGDGSVLLQADGLNNDDGEISGHQLTLELNTLSNRGGLVQGNELSLTVPELINTGGTIAAIAIDGAGLALSVNGLLENSDGLLLSRGQQFSVDAHTLLNHDGEILHSGNGSMVLRAGALNNDLGRVQSNTDLSVYVQDVTDFSNRAGMLSAVDNLIIDAIASIDNTDGQLLAGQSLTVSSKHLDNQNGLLSATAVSVRADTIDNTGEGVIEAETLALHADTLTNSGTLLATGNIGQSLEFDITSFINTGLLESHGVDLLLNNINLHSDGGQIIHQGAGELRIVASGTFDNRDGTLATRGVLNFQADAIDNRAGKLIAGKQLDITIDAINNQGGLIQSGDGLSLVLQDFDNSQGGQVLIGGSTAAQLNVSHFFNNRDGSVIYQGDNSLTLNAGSFSNVNGILGGSGNLDIIIDSLFDNTDGQVIGETLVRMTASELLNLGEGYLEANRLQLGVDQIVNDNIIFASGTTGESLLLNAANIINSGLIESHGTDFNLLDVGLNNTDGALIHRGAGNLVIRQQSLVNNNGMIAGHGNVSMSIAELYNAAGEILSANGLILSGELFENRGGVVQADQLNIQVKQIENTDDGWLIAVGDSASTIMADRLTNNDSQIIANASLGIEADRFENFTGLLEADTLAVAAGQLDNSGVVNATSLNINANTLLNREGAELLADYVQLDTDKLDNLGLILAYGTSSEGLEIVARAIQNSGAIESHGNHLNLSVSQTLINSGDIYHQGNGNLQLEAAWLDNREGTIAGKQLVVNSDTLDNRKGQIYSENQLTIHALAVDNRTGILQADQQLSLTANSFDNREEGVLFAKQQGDLTLASLDNHDGTITGKNFNLSVGSLLNQSGEILVERLQLVGGNLDNTDGVIATTNADNESLVISMDNKLINQRGLIQTDGATAFIHADLLDNTDGDIFHLGSDELLLRAAKLINQGGNLYGENNVSLSLADSLSNNDGNIFSGNKLDVTAANLLNRGGSLSSGNSLLLTLDSLINAGSETDSAVEGLISSESVVLAANSLDNLQGGRIQGNYLTVTGTALTNNSTIASYADADNAFVLAFDQIYNTGHLESSGENWRINTGVLSNEGGVILHRGNGDLLLFVDQLINHNDGLIDAANRLEVQAQTVDNTQGFIVARGDSASLINAEQLDNADGYINADDLTISGITLTNEKGEISGKSVSLNVNAIKNIDGSMIADSLTIQADRLDNLQSEPNSSYIHATDLSINAQLLNNHAIIQGQQLILTGNALHNEGGSILSFGEYGESLQLQFSDVITNRDGRIESWGSDLQIVGNLHNQYGKVILAGSGVLSLENLTDNASGEIFSIGDLKITADGIYQTINNQSGTLQANKNVSLIAEKINNANKGNIFAGDQLSVTATTFDNADGLILSAGTGDNALSLKVSGILDNTHGEIETHADNFALTSYKIINDGGEIRHLGEGTFSIYGEGNFTNDRGELGTRGNLDIHLDGSFINDGKLIAMKDLFIDAADIKNLSDRLISAANIHFSADHNRNQGTIQSNKLSASGENFDNRGGKLLVLGGADQSIVLDVDQFDNRDGGLLEINGGNNTLSANISNYKGRIVNLSEGVLAFFGLNNQNGVVLSTGSLDFTQDVLNNHNGVLQTAANITANIEDLDNRLGTFQAGQFLDVQARLVDNSLAGTLISGEGFRLSALDKILNTGGHIESLANNMELNTALLTNQKGVIAHDGSGKLLLNIQGDLNNNGGKISTKGQLALEADRISNNKLDDRAASIFAANLSISAQELTNVGGHIQATEKLHFTLPHLDNQGGFILSAGTGSNALIFDVGSIDNRAGTLEIHGDQSSFHNIAFDNRNKGIINHLGNGTLTFSGNGGLQNAGGILQSAGDIYIQQHSLDNRGGQINAGLVRMNLEGDLNNSEEAKLAGSRLHITANAINNQKGILAGLGNYDDALQLNVGHLDNSNGTLRSGADTWVLNLDSLLNTGGSIFHTGNNQLTLTSDYLLTTSGTIASTANLSVAAQGLDNSGQLIADKNIYLSSGGDITNRVGAAIKAGELLTINGDGTFVNQGDTVALEGLSIALDGLLNNQSRIITDGLLATITASSIVNTGTIAQNNVDGSLTLTAADITLNAGVVKADGSLVFNATNIANNAIISAGDFSATSFNQFYNNNGSTTEAGSINFQGNSFLNDGTFIATNADNSLILNVSDAVNTKLLVSNSTNQSFMGSFTNSGEFRHAGRGVLTLGNAGSVNLQGGSVSTAGTANLSGTLTGSGNLFAETAININSSGTFNNLGSTLYTKGALTINSAVNNQAGKLLADGNLLIQTTGSVNNSSNGVIQGQALNISAGSITNTGGGAITSTGTSAGSISAGYINNQGGKISSANQSFSITSTSSSINNAGGSIHHTGGGTLTVNSRTDLLNGSNGKIITGGALSAIISGLLSNSNGEITAGSFSISAATLNNNGGAINALSGAANGSQITAGGLNNAGGNISANNRNLTIDASTIDNGNGSISHAGSGLLSIKAPSIFNNTQASSIRTNGALDLVTQGSFNNGGVISSVGNLVIKAIAGSLVQVDNTHKISSSAGEVSIVASEKITNSGTIEGQEKVDLKAGELTNSGTIKSVKEVSLDMDRLSLTGTILADELLSLKVKESVSVGSNEKLSTKGSLVLITQGDITNFGTIAAEKSLELGGINLFNNNQINGGSGQSKLIFSGTINNNQTITSNDRMEVRTGNYVNNGITSVANNLTLIANNNIENNSGKVIFSAGDMTLGAGGAINNTSNATIFSIGNMTLEGSGGSGSRSQSLNNIDSRIEAAAGSLIVNTNSLTNRRSQVQYSQSSSVNEDRPPEETMEVSYFIDKDRKYMGLEMIGYYVTTYYTTHSTIHTATASGPDSVIKSGSNFTINAGDILNEYADISSGGNLTINANTLRHVVAQGKEESETYAEKHWDTRGHPHYNWVDDPELVEKKSETTGPKIGAIRVGGRANINVTGAFEVVTDTYNSGALSYFTGVNATASGGVTGSGAANANGGNARVDATRGQAGNTNNGAFNHQGRVDGGDVDGGSETKVSLYDPDQLNKLSGDEVVWAEQGLSGQSQQAVQLNASGEMKSVGLGSDFQLLANAIELTNGQSKSNISINGSDFDADTALENLAQLGAGVIEGNDAVEQQGATTEISSGTAQGSNTGKLNNYSGSQLSDSSSRNITSVDGGDKDIELSTVMLEGIVGSASVNASAGGGASAISKEHPDGSIDPLILSLLPDNFNLDNLSGLYVSNQNPESNYLVETRPEFTQYSNFLGSEYLLNELGYDPDKTVKRLGDAFYENQLIRDELSSKANTRFVSGATNDYEQMEMLMDNAVAASKSLELSVGISLNADQVAALTEDIVWLVEQTVNGEKVLVPTLYLASINKDNLLPDGSVIAVAGSMHVNAGAGISNDSVISTGGNLVMETDGGFINTGDLFTFSSLGITTGSNFDNYGNIKSGGDSWISAGDMLTNHNTGLIVSDGILDLRAVNDLVNAQGYLEGRDVSLTSELGSIINRTEYEHITYDYGTGSRTHTVVGDSSTIVSHNSLSMTAGKDLDLQGSNFKADSDIRLNAGNDILLNGIERRAASAETTNKISVVKKETSWDVVSLDAGGNLILSAGRDIAGQGTQMSAGNIASLTAGRDVNLAAVANSTHNEDIRSRKKVIDTTVTHTQANITSGTDTFIKAGQDVNLIGANIDAQGNVLLHAERDTNLVVVNDSEYHYDYTKQKKSFGRSKTTINETLSETAVGGTIKSGGNVLINAQGSDAGLITLDSGNVNIIGGAITAEKHVVISADEDINIVASTYNELDFHSTSKSGLGGLSKKAAGEVEEKTLLNRAGIEATGGNVSLLSGNNIALIAADVTAGGNINMEAVDQLLIGAGEAVSKSASWSKSSGLFSGGNIYSAKEAKAGESITSGEGSVLNAGGRITGDSGSAKIIGSDLHGDNGGVQLLTDIGSIEVLASKTTSQSYSYEKSMTVGLGDLVEGLSNPNDLVKNQDGRLTAKIADATYDEVDTKTNVTSMTGSNITSGTGNIHLQSADSIVIEGSNLEVGKDREGEREGEREGDVNLVAVNDVTVREATDTLDTETKETHGKAELSVVVQHQAAEVVKAVIAVDEAKDQLEKAKKDYKSYERNLDQLEKQLQLLEGEYANKAPGVNYDDLLELRELVGDLKNDKEWYQAGVALAAVNLASTTTALVQQINAAASSTTTWGFNAGLQLDIDASKTNSSYSETTAVGSTVSGNNVRIQTGTIDENGKLVSNGTTTTIQGSHITADNKITVHTGDLNILSSKNTTESQTETENGHITAQITVYGAAGGASVSGSFDRSKGSDRSTTINNSTLDGKQIELVTTGDTNIRGGNVHASEHLYADIGGDLNLESQQNRSNSRNTSAGVSGGVSFGGKAEGEQTVQDKLDTAKGNALTNNIRGVSDVGGMAGVSGGLSAGNGMSVTRETVLSSLTSGGTATVNVAGNTQITGALLGTIDKDGNDLGQLTFSTGSLSFTDLRNTYQNTQTNIGVSTNLSVGEAKTNPREGQTTAETTDGKTLYASTSNLAYSNSQENSASKTLATLGHGDITVGGVQLEKDGQLTEAGKATDSPLTSLNRDTANTEKTLWDSEQSQSIDATLDHRLLSKDGWSEIADDVEGAREGIEKGKNFIIANLSSLDDELKGQVGTAGERAYYEARKAGMTDEQATAYLSDPRVADLMAKLSEAEQAIKQGQSESGNEADGQKTQTGVGTGSGSVLATVRVSDNAMEASGVQLALQTMGEASRYIEELKKTNPTEAAAIEFAINAASGGPIKAGIAKAVEQGLVVSGLADNLAQVSSFITETVSAKVVDVEYTRDELVERIDNQKDDDLGKMTEGTGFFFGTVLGVAGSSKKGSEDANEKRNSTDGNSIKNTDDSFGYTERNLPISDIDRLNEINKTLDRIEAGGPYPYRQDGTVFENRKGSLPDGNYLEYTVDTPDAGHRAKRRIVINQDNGKTYYTDSHYESFVEIDSTKR